MALFLAKAYALPCDFDFWPFYLTINMGNLSVNFELSRDFCSRIRADRAQTDRQMQCNV